MGCKKLTGYLAGPIEHVSFSAASIWRNDMKQYFKGIIYFHDPLFTETHALRVEWEKHPEADRDSLGYLLNGPSIYHKDRLMISKSDFVLVNLLNHPSIIVGSLIEVGMAIAMGKPVIVIADDKAITDNPFIAVPCIVFKTDTDTKKYLLAIAQDF